MVNKWIFPLNKKLEENEQLLIEDMIKRELKDWNAHGKPVEYHLNILFQQIIIIKALNQTSGCSIDSMQKKIRNLVHELGYEVLPNQYIMYLDNNQELKYFDFREIDKKIHHHELNENTLIIDKQKLLEGESNPLSILKETWLVRYC